MAEEIITSVEKINTERNLLQGPKSTMVQYAINCQATYEEQPFNEVDSLILSWLSYLRIPEEVLPKKVLNHASEFKIKKDGTYDLQKSHEISDAFSEVSGEIVGTQKDAGLDNIIEKTKEDGSVNGNIEETAQTNLSECNMFTDTDSCRIRDILKAGYYEEMLRDVWSPDETLLMLLALDVNPRFENMTICLRREELDPSEGKQFAAVTFQLTPNLTYIAFRGTDKTLTGWEEDFRLALLDPVPAQLLAAEYLSAAGSIFRGKLITGGHSKGGNLAVYAAAYCEQEVQERIQEVYTHDGRRSRIPVR